MLLHDTIWYTITWMHLQPHQMFNWLCDFQENICMERRIMTPLKSESVTAHRRVSSPDLTHITPIKQSDRAHADPWTPTANLKMLISAASPDIRDRELKKTLFRPIENEEKVTEEDEDLDDSCQVKRLINHMCPVACRVQTFTMVIRITP